MKPPRKAASIFLDDDDDFFASAPVSPESTALDDPVIIATPTLPIISVVSPRSTEVSIPVSSRLIVPPTAVITVEAPQYNSAPETRADLYSLLNEQREDQDLLEDSDGLPDLVSIVDRAIASDFDPSIFTERTFPVAPNIIEWCRNPDFLGYSMDLFPRQIQVLAHFFGDVCFFCSDTDYIFNVPLKEAIGNVLDRFALLENGVCPKCRRNRTEIYREWHLDPRFQDYNVLDSSVLPMDCPPNEFVGVWGQRSGKSHLTATFGFSYILHRFLSLPRPTSYFMQPSNTMFEATFVAPTLSQVEKNAWDPFRQAFYDSPWFKEVKNSLVDDGKRLGVKAFHSGSTFFAFLSKRLAVHMQAANGTSLRGATRIFGCLDGASLINTDIGLLPIEAGDQLVGTQAFVRRSSNQVLNYCCMGVKPVQRLVLDRGYNLVSTLDHRIKSLTPDLEEVWKEASDLELGDYVAVSLGADFPVRLPLVYQPKFPARPKVRAYEIIDRLKRFTAADLGAAFSSDKLYVLTTSLTKRGFVRKTYIKGKGKNAGCVYEITDKFDLSLLREEALDSLCRDRDSVVFPSEMTVELAYLLGYYVSEGSYAEGAVEFLFSNTDTRVVDHFFYCFRKVFGIDPKLRTFKTRGGRTAYVAAIAYGVIKDFLRYLGMAPSVAATKTVPWSILRAPRDAVLAFLSAYLEGDGSINSTHVRAVSCSRKLVFQLQLLLLNLGVISECRLHRPPSGTAQALYQISLGRYDSMVLVPQLTCVTKGKEFDFTTYKHRYDHYKIPFVRAYVDTSLHGGSVAKSAYVLSNLNEVAYDNYALKHLKAENVSKYGKALKLVDTGLVWLRVVEKTFLGDRQVHDIDVDSAAHEFTANGIVVHNSVDELSRFNITEDGKKRTGVRTGEAILDAVDNSLMTVRSKAELRRRSQNDYNALDGYLFLISSPSSVSDPIMTRAAAAPISPRMFYTHYKTFEMNPTLSKEFLRSQVKSEEVFLRDFCAIPPRATSPFFSDTRLLADLSKFDELSLQLKYTIDQAKSDDGAVVRLRPTLYDLHPDQYTGRILVVDNGEVNNAFALCVARYSPEVDGCCIEDFIEVAPYRGHAVDLAWCYDKLIVPLVSSFKFLHVCFDRWNSAYAVQDLRTKFGLDAQVYTLKWKDFELYREDIRGMKVQFPEPEVSPDDLLSIKEPSLRSRHPRAHFQLQLTTVNQFGNKLLKPDNDNDDLFRCSVMAHRFLSKHKEEYRAFAATAARHRGLFRSVGVFRGASARQGGGSALERSSGGSGRSAGFVGGPASRGARNSSVKRQPGPLR
jgi:intein/homing endonuclease